MNFIEIETNKGKYELVNLNNVTNIFQYDNYINICFIGGEDNVTRIYCDSVEECLKKYNYIKSILLGDNNDTI